MADTTYTLNDAKKNKNVATIGALNTVYDSLLTTIDREHDFFASRTADIYTVQGSVDDLAGLYSITAANNGDIYNVKNAVGNVSGQNYVCLKTYKVEDDTYKVQEYTLSTDTAVTAGTLYYKADSRGGAYTPVPFNELTAAKVNPSGSGWYIKEYVPLMVDGVTVTKSNISSHYDLLWDALGGMVGAATQDSLGLIKLGAEKKTQETERGVYLDGNQKACIDIPTATGSTLGLIKSNTTGNSTDGFTRQVTVENGVGTVAMPEQFSGKSITVTNTGGNALTIEGQSISNGEATTAALVVNGGIVAISGITASAVYHAVWNDISDAIEVQDDLDLTPGCCYCFDGKEYHKSRKYCEKGIVGLHSDTAGSILGKKGRHRELDVSIGGFVLAYVDKLYRPGTPLTSAPDGILTRMKAKDVLLHPERLVAVFWKDEPSEEWGSDTRKVKVDGRRWVKVK